MTTRVLQVLLSPRIGGAETLVRELTPRLARRGIRSETLFIDSAGGSHSRIGRLQTIRAKYRSFRPHVVVAHSAIPSVYARLAIGKNVPVVSVLHSAGDDFVSPVLRLAELVLRSRTSAIVAVGATQASVYESRFGVGSVSAVIPNGIAAAELNVVSTEHVRVVTLARFTAQKDPQLWAEVAKNFSAIDPSVIFEWWGPNEDPTSWETVQSVIRRNRMNAHLKGPTNRPSLRLAGAAVLFHPAARESQGIALLEAAASGLPIVCADSIDKNFPGGIASQTFQTGNAESATVALANVLQNYSEHSTDSRFRMSEISRQYSIDNTALAYGELIDAIRTGSGQGTPDNAI